MGYMRNKALIISGFSESTVLSAHAVAKEVHLRFGLESLVGEVVKHAVNGGACFAAFYVSPDGSKEGWNTSDDGGMALDLVAAYLEENPQHYLNWAVVLLGGDDDEYGVLEASGKIVLPDVVIGTVIEADVIEATYEPLMVTHEPMDKS